MQRRTVRLGAWVLEGDGGGVSTYARELMTELYPLLSGVEVSAIVQASEAGQVPEPITPMCVPDSRGVRRMFSAKFATDRVDLLHGLDVDLPLRGPRATVATVHDLSVFDVPWAFSRFRATGERVLVRDTLRRADVLVAVSNFTAQRIHDLCGRDAVVTPLAPARWARPPAAEEVAAIKSRYALPDQFVLQVGTVEPRKQPHLVADAARDIGLPCVLAGKGSDGPDAPAGTVGLGFVSQQDLPALYASATVVAYASVYEGFGLPPIEAMACGAAVVASKVGALPDVVGDGAILIDGQRPEDWSMAFRELAKDADAREALCEAGQRAVQGLTWNGTAELTMEAYRLAGLPV